MSKTTIFAVDDSVTTLYLLKERLEPVYNVITMESAETMFQKLSEQTPALILLDYYMPVTSADDVMKRLKGDDRYKEIPIIIISGSSYPELKHEIYGMGAVDFIAKQSIDNNSLVEKVEKWIN